MFTSTLQLHFSTFFRLLTRDLTAKLSSSIWYNDIANRAVVDLFLILRCGVLHRLVMQRLADVRRYLSIRR